MEFERFLDAELGRLTGYARLLTGDRQLAHDVLADALMRARGQWSKISAMQSPGGYVRRMVTTTFLGEKRRWASRKIRPTSTGELPKVGVRPAQHCVNDRAELRQLLSDLPKQQRAAIVLRYYLDADDTEIAAELGCSAGAARTYLWRALATLRIAVSTDDAGRTAAADSPGTVNRLVPRRSPDTSTKELS